MTTYKDAFRFGCPRGHKQKTSLPDDGYLENTKNNMQSFACGKSVGEVEGRVLSTVEDSANGVRDNVVSGLNGSKESLEDIAGHVRSKITGKVPYQVNDGSNKGLYLLTPLSCCSLLTPCPEEQDPADRGYQDDIKLIDSMEDSKLEDFLREQNKSRADRRP